MIKTLTCHTVVCDECGDALNPADEGEIHYSTTDEARNEAQQYYEWTCNGERDLCPQCTATQQCAELGHVPALVSLGGRYCTRCEADL